MRHVKHIALFILLLLVIGSCKKENYDINNLNNNKIGIIGHGGMGEGNNYPINSQESILKCLNLGATGCEIDIQMTKDCVLVAFHDEQLNGYTNNTGRVYDLTWNEIRNTTYSGPLYSKYKVVPLVAIFDEIDTPQQYTYFFDCKNFDQDISAVYVNTFNNALLSLINQYSISNNVNLEFKKTEFFNDMQQKRPDLKLFVNSDFNQGIEIAEQWGLTGISINSKNITFDQVSAAHEHGIMIASWGVDSKEKNLENIKKNVDFIQTDRLKHLIKILK